LLFELFNSQTVILIKNCLTKKGIKRPQRKLESVSWHVLLPRCTVTMDFGHLWQVPFFLGKKQCRETIWLERQVEVALDLPFDKFIWKTKYFYHIKEVVSSERIRAIMANLSEISTKQLKRFSVLYGSQNTIFWHFATFMTNNSIFIGTFFRL
jgi:hypothetical protein